MTSTTGLRSPSMKHDPVTLFSRFGPDETGNSSCFVRDGYPHPEFPSYRSAGPYPSGPAADLYDRSKDIGHGDGDEGGTLTHT
ncbi:hypothetical protein [Streptomyces sp. NPDC092370]|uniref:hypothetical protein n=1 Tax=Streptomyces sp. NPDC092370 TaxID=3366016 RepID=UPI00380D7A15